MGNPNFRPLDTGTLLRVFKAAAEVTAVKGQNGRLGVVTVEMVAERHGVNRHSVAHARALERSGHPILKAAVLGGEIALSAAYQITRIVPDQAEQEQALRKIKVASGSRSIREILGLKLRKMGRNRLITTTGRIDQAMMSLRAVTDALLGLFAALPPDDRAVWRRQIKAVRFDLTRLTSAELQPEED